MCMSTLPDISFPQKFQDGRRIPEVVIFATENDTKVISTAVSVAKLLLLPVWGTVSTSGLYLMVVYIV